MGKGLGDNYREGTGRGAEGPGGASPANMALLCWQQDSSVCCRRLKKKKKKERKGKKYILASLLRAALEVPWVVGDGGPAQIWHPVIIAHATEKVRNQPGAGGEVGWFRTAAPNNFAQPQQLSSGLHADALVAGRTAQEA